MKLEKADAEEVERSRCSGTQNSDLSERDRLRLLSQT
jgi:hypothetical protein